PRLELAGDPLARGGRQRRADRVEDQRRRVQQRRDDERRDQPVAGRRRHAVLNRAGDRADDVAERGDDERPVEGVQHRPREHGDAQWPTRRPQQPPGLPTAYLASGSDLVSKCGDHDWLTYPPPLTEEKQISPERLRAAPFRSPGSLVRPWRGRVGHATVRTNAAVAAATGRRR